MRWSGIAALLMLSICVDVWAKDRSGLDDFNGIKKTALSCAAAYGVLQLSPPPVENLPKEHLKTFKISEWSLREFRIPGAEAFELKSDWEDAGRPRSFERNVFQSEEKIQNVVNTVLARSPDVLMFTEILDLASLRMLAAHPKYLNGAYRLYVHPVNQFGSNIAILVKKGLQLNFQFESHVNVRRIDKFGRNRRVFTRDVPALLIRAAGDETSDNVVIVLGVHAKSVRPAEYSDIQSDEIRLHEFIGIDAIKRKYRAKYPRARIGTLGDFNIDVQNTVDYQILKSDSEGFLDLKGVPPGDRSRATHLYFDIDRAGNTVRTSPTQRDDFLMDDGLFTYFLDGQVLPFYDTAGNPKADPTSIRERYENPTDHKMIETIFDFFSLFYGKPH
jgi:hypothetical protein